MPARSNSDGVVRVADDCIRRLPGVGASEAVGVLGSSSEKTASGTCGMAMLSHASELYRLSRSPITPILGPRRLLYTETLL